MKGQQEVLTPLLFTGILIAVVGSVYLWGVPLIQKNQDITTLHKSEDFIKNLNEKILKVANTEGSDKLTIPAGVFYFDPNPNAETLTGTAYLVVKTKGTIYSSGPKIPFVRNDTCQLSSSCIMGMHDPSLMRVQSSDMDGEYLANYTLTYRSLKASSAPFAETFQINLTGSRRTAGENHDVIIEFRGMRTWTDTSTHTVANIEIRVD